MKKVYMLLLVAVVSMLASSAFGHGYRSCGRYNCHGAMCRTSSIWMSGGSFQPVPPTIAGHVRQQKILGDDKCLGCKGWGYRGMTRTGNIRYAGVVCSKCKGSGRFIKK